MKRLYSGKSWESPSCIAMGVCSYLSRLISSRVPGSRKINKSMHSSHLLDVFSCHSPQSGYVDSTTIFTTSRRQVSCRQFFRSVASTESRTSHLRQPSVATHHVVKPPPLLAHRRKHHHQRPVHHYFQSRLASCTSSVSKMTGPSNSPKRTPAAEEHQQQ